MLNEHWVYLCPYEAPDRREKYDRLMGAPRTVTRGVWPLPSNSSTRTGWNAPLTYGGTYQLAAGDAPGVAAFNRRTHGR